MPYRSSGALPMLPAPSSADYLILASCDWCGGFNPSPDDSAFCSADCSRAFAGYPDTTDEYEGF